MFFSGFCTILCMREAVTISDGARIFPGPLKRPTHFNLLFYFQISLFCSLLEPIRAVVAHPVLRVMEPGGLGALRLRGLGAWRVWWVWGLGSLGAWRAWVPWDLVPSSILRPTSGLTAIDCLAQCKRSQRSLELVKKGFELFLLSLVPLYGYDCFVQVTNCTRTRDSRADR